MIVEKTQHLKFKVKPKCVWETWDKLWLLMVSNTAHHQVSMSMWWCAAWEQHTHLQPVMAEFLLPVKMASLLARSCIISLVSLSVTMETGTTSAGHLMFFKDAIFDSIEWSRHPFGFVLNTCCSPNHKLQFNLLCSKSLSNYFENWRV